MHPLCTPWCHLEAEGPWGYLGSMLAINDHSPTKHHIPRTRLRTPHALIHLILPAITQGRSYHNIPLMEEAAETLSGDATGHGLCMRTWVYMFISICIHVFVSLRPRVLSFPCIFSLKPQIPYRDIFCFLDEETIVQRFAVTCPRCPGKCPALSTITLWAGSISPSFSFPFCDMNLHCFLTTRSVLGH